MKFYYGFENMYIDISKIVFEKCFRDHKIIITSGDHERSLIFGDPFPGFIKNIKVVTDDGDVTIYETGQNISIDYSGIFYKKEPANVVSKICVYTGIFGNYDRSNRHVKQTIPCDFIYFYDAGNKMNDPSEKKSDSIPTNLSSVLTSAWIRTYPFDIKELDDYDIVIYIDGNKKIDNPNFIRDIIGTVHKSWDLMATEHPTTKCAYVEAVSSGLEKFKNTDLKGQSEVYKKNGFPSDYGLYWNGLLIYNKKRDIEKMKLFQDLYWHEFCSYVIDPNLPFHPQGQVSFPYCLWKQPINFVSLPVTLGWNSKYLKSQGHLK